MQLDFKIDGGLTPVIIQDDRNGQVLMLGYMNEEAYKITIDSGWVTFYSRSKQRLWTKGETSGNKLKVVSILSDCDNDTLLIKVVPVGPVCHTGQYSCFESEQTKGFLYKLQERITKRIEDDASDSYTSKLYKRGINKVAQKVGEEAVELVIEAKDDNLNLFKNEAADLLYHFLILLKAKGVTLNDIEGVLMNRA